MNKLISLIIAVAVIIGTVPVAGAGNPDEAFIDDYVSDIVEVDAAGGAVIAVLKDGEFVFHKAYGEAMSGVPATIDNVWEWGSISKLLIWVSAFQLVEQGKLDLGADIRGYLPDNFFKKLRHNEPITFYNLMHHNAGWEDTMKNIFVRNPNKIQTLEESLRISEPNQIFKPGEIMAYSNYASGVAGFVIERIAGISYWQYVNENIFAPLNMNDTAIHPTQADNPEVGTRREQMAENRRIYIPIYPAGSVIGTSGDLAKFMTALIGNSADSQLFASPETQMQMLTTSYWAAEHTDEPIPRVAHGFFVYDYSVRAVGHSGGTDSFATNAAFVPETGLTVIVLTSQQWGSKLYWGLFDELFGGQRHVPIPEDRSELPNAQDVAGHYRATRVAFTGYAKIMQYFLKFTAVDENTILLGGKYEYTQIAPYVFQCLEEGYRISFDVKSGTVTRLSAPGSDHIPATVFEVGVVYVGYAAFVSVAVYAVVAIVLLVIGMVKRKRRGEKANILQKLNCALCFSIFALVANVALLVARAFAYATYSELQAYFAVNMVFVAVAAGLIAAMIIRRKHCELLRRSKLFCAFTGIVAAIAAAALFGWELFY